MGTIRLFCKFPAILTSLGVLLSTGIAVAGSYQVHNLVSDQPGMADTMDPDLINGWGVAFNTTGVAWVADNHTAKSTLYDGLGAKQSLVVNVPGPPGAAPVPGAPTGIVFHSGSDFVVTDGTNSGPAAFIFAGEDGIISGWSPSVPPPAPSTQAQIASNQSGRSAIYKGLALAVSGGSDFLYAADFHNNHIDVFNSSFALQVNPPGSFIDAGVPAGFAPFNIQNIDGNLYVAYAQQDAMAHDEVPGAGFGYVSVFDPNGNLLHHLIAQGQLNAPWGLAKSPANFGTFSGALLVGNFGNGQIHAYDQSTGALLGALTDASNVPISIDGLWGIQFGNGLANQATNALFFAAGPGGEEHGLFGVVTAAIPEPKGLALSSVGLLIFATAAGKRRQ